MTDKQTNALKLALEALEWINRVNAMEYEYQQKARESLNAIYEALASGANEQPAQQPPTVAELLCVCGAEWEWRNRGWELVGTPPASKPEQQEPVAVVSGYYGGQCVILPTNPAMLFNSGTAFYTSPQPSKPLTDEQIKRMAAKWFLPMYWPLCNTFARAIEAAHGIKGDA